MQRYYAGITTRMRSEIDTISAQMSHAGEKGRNNEFVLTEFLKRHLPQRYTVSTGKVLAVGGAESGQVDVIVHDRLNIPALLDTHAWSFVPVEAARAVISVKTTLTMPELRDALASLKSVRVLPRRAATLWNGDKLWRVPEQSAVRPRAYVFAFKSSWTEPQGLQKAFVEAASEIEDAFRPNGVCALEQACVIRKPYTLDTILFAEHAMMHFFIHLTAAMDTLPPYQVDLSRYFTEDYGLAK